MKIFLVMFLVFNGINGDWIRLHHLTPAQLNIAKTEPVSVIDDLDSNLDSKIKFDNVTSLVDIIEPKLESENVYPLEIDTKAKETLLGTYWILSQQDNYSLRGKLIFLQKVKEHLLQGIWEQSKTLWNRRSDARSVIGFPSMEGALVTIAFLTFAVFLIKIVQQFVQGLQGISPNTVGFRLPTGTMMNASARYKHHSDINDATKRIFQYMEEFKIHHEL